MINYGKLITLEGIEGVGKSTHVPFIKEWLTKKGYNVLTTREPGGTPVAEKLREVLLHKWDEPINKYTELLLMFAGRAQHIQQVILPALQQGKCVICDRFTDASFAYQGYGREIPFAHITELQQWIQKDVTPELTLLFDASVEIGLARVFACKTRDRIEAEKYSFFERVRNGYLKIAEQKHARIRVINADNTIESIQKIIVKNLEEVLCQD